MARLWMQRSSEEVDFVIHVLLSLAPRSGGAPGSPGARFDTAGLRQLLLESVAVLPRFSSLMVHALSGICSQNARDCVGSERAGGHGYAEPKSWSDQGASHGVLL